MKMGASLLGAAALAFTLGAAPEGSVDTALVLAVDVSGSVSEARYALQMEGIAAAFEDPEIEETILAGRHHAMFATLVEWSDRPQTTIAWTRIASHADARAFAARVRLSPRADSQFTCMSQALQMIGGKVLPFLPAPADHVVVDVSGDGAENCNPSVPIDAARDALVGEGATINGLPILEGEEAATLAPWYRDHVIGGVGAFLIPAAGFEDVARAMRRKFITEISLAK
ncbi:MAG TPA: DUF1194 domain-containing protein [Stellaceae bacterium]|nr:DUF1194 domain-containing protein [Stellaceae bacterium]